MMVSGPFPGTFPDRVLDQHGIHRDPLDPNLRLHVGKGTASWQVYLPGGQRLGLGRLPAVSVHDARAASEKMRRRLQAGLDPRGAIPAGSQSLGDMIDAWERRKTQTRVTSAAERAAAVRRHVSRLLAVPVSDLTSDDLDIALGDLKQSHPPTARNVIATLRAIWNDARNRKLHVGENPALLVDKPRAETNEGFFDLGALGRLWRDSEALSEPDRLYLRFLMASGCRRGETLQLTVGNVSFDEGRIVIPGRITKTKSSTWVSISPLLGEVLRSAIAGRNDPSAPVFFHEASFTTRRAARLACWANERTKIRASKKGASGWVPLHGFRTSFQTIGQVAGIHGDHIDACLSHFRKVGSRASYDFYTFWPERERVWRQWSAVLEHLAKNSQNTVTEADLRLLTAGL